MPRMQEKRKSLARRIRDKISARNVKQSRFAVLVYDAETEHAETYRFHETTWEQAAEAAKEHYRVEFPESKYLIVVCVESS